MRVLPDKREVSQVPLGHLLPKRTHVFKTPGAPCLTRGSTSHLLEGSGQILWCLHFPSPLPGCGSLPCACPAREWELCQRQGEGEGKAGRCRTPLPSAFVGHWFPPQPWEPLAGRCSSSCAASSSPSARFGRCLSAPCSTPSFPPWSRGWLGWLPPGDLGHPCHLLPGCGRRPRSSTQAQGRILVSP